MPVGACQVPPHLPFSVRLLTHHRLTPSATSHTSRPRADIPAAPSCAFASERHRCVPCRLPAAVSRSGARDRQPAAAAAPDSPHALLRSCLGRTHHCVPRCFAALATAAAAAAFAATRACVLSGPRSSQLYPLLPPRPSPGPSHLPAAPPPAHPQIWVPISSGSDRSFFASSVLLRELPNGAGAQARGRQQQTEQQQESDHRQPAFMMAATLPLLSHERALQQRGGASSLLARHRSAHFLSADTPSSRPSRPSAPLPQRTACASSLATCPPRPARPRGGPSAPSAASSRWRAGRTSSEPRGPRRGARRGFLTLRKWPRAAPAALSLARVSSRGSWARTHAHPRPPSPIHGHSFIAADVSLMAHRSQLTSPFLQPL